MYLNMHTYDKKRSVRVSHLLSNRLVVIYYYIMCARNVSFFRESRKIKRLVLIFFLNIFVLAFVYMTFVYNITL